jgi:hypothetical protein
MAQRRLVQRIRWMTGKGPTPVTTKRRRSALIGLRRRPRPIFADCRHSIGGTTPRPRVALVWHRTMRAGHDVRVVHSTIWLIDAARFVCLAAVIWMLAQHVRRLAYRPRHACRRQPRPAVGRLAIPPSALSR